MGQQTIGIGNAANDGTGDPARTAFDKVNDNFDELYALSSRTVNAGDVQWAALATVELRITAAIDHAVTINAERVYVPANMLPYTAGSVTFNAAIRMVREGGDWNFYDVQAYGAAGDGVSNDLAAFQAARLGAGTTGNVFIPERGPYLLTGPLVCDANSGHAVSLVGSPARARPILRFSLAAGEDAITMSGGAGYEAIVISSIEIDCQDTGRDALRITSTDHPRLSDLYIHDAGQDGLVLYANGWGWIENLLCESVRVFDCGRHLYNLTVSGLVTEGAFINECTFVSCEGRNPGASATNYPVYGIVSHAWSGATISDLLWLNCNFDLGNTVAGTPTRRIMYLDYAAGGLNNFNHWTIIGGGWENTSATDIAFSDAIAAASGGNAPGWTWIGGIVGGRVLHRTSGLEPLLNVDPTDTRVSIGGFVRFAASSPAALGVGNNNNYSAGAIATVRLAADAGGSTLTGISDGTLGGASGRLLRIINISANTLTLAHQNVNSTDSNRLLSPTGADVALGANGVADLEYDSATARWRIVNVLT